MKAVIEADNLCCRFRGVRAVEGLTLSVEPGQIYGLLGPNGAGKSTTIRTMLGLQRPSWGGSALLGVDSRKLGRREFERIGYVSESQQQPDWLTVAQVLAYCAPMYPTWDREFANHLLDAFELPRDRKLKNLSRGMKMKVNLISSIAYRPELLIMDEPFGGLDPVVREDFIDGILQITGQESWTVLLSSHDMAEVERLADRVGILKDGRLIVDDDMGRLMERFRRIEVTGFSQWHDTCPNAWKQVASSGKRVEFIHSEFEEDRWDKEWRSVFGDEARVEVSTLELREIYLALMRNERKAFDQEKGEAA